MAFKKIDIKFIANELDEIKIAKDGKISYDLFQAKDYEILLNNAIKLPGIPEIVKSRIIHKAILSINSKGKVTESSIKKRIDELEKAYNNRPAKKYVMITELSIARNIKLKNVHIEGAYITFNPKLSKRFYDERNNLLESAKMQMQKEFPNNYTKVRISTIARSEEEAFNKAMDSFDIYRGMLNYLINKTTYRRITHGGRKTINLIQLGPVHTCHKISGEVESKSWWYETNYQAPQKVYAKTDVIEKEISDLKCIRRKMNQSFCKNELTEALKRYCRALDVRDWQVSFIKLWGVLELLTGTMNVNYNTTISRVSSLHPNSDFHELILNNLKEYRNASIHSDLESSNGETLEIQLYQLKYYVELLIRFLLNNDQRFSKLAEFWEFMDVLRDRESINHKIEMLSKARFYIA